MDSLNRISAFLNLATDIKDLDPKIENRIKKMKEIYQKISEQKEIIRKQVGDIQDQIKALEKQADIFHKQLLPILKELEDHTIEAEGIFVELKKGKRSPKVGYEYLADKVSSELLVAAEEAMAEVAAFARTPSITLTATDNSDMIKISGVMDWMKTKWRLLTDFVKKFTKRNNTIKGLIKDLKKTV